MYNLFLADTSTSNASSGTEELKKIFTQPAVYIVLGVIVLLILVFVIARRFIKAQPGTEVLVLRDGKVHKVITDKESKRYFLKFFKDKVGATVNVTEQSYNTDKVLINDGPDALYKLHLVIKYQVTDSTTFYPMVNKFNDYFAESLNDDLRVFAQNNGAALIVKDFDTNKEKIISYLNNLYKEIAVEINDIKIKAIEPLGRR